MSAKFVYFNLTLTATMLCEVIILAWLTYVHNSLCSKNLARPVSVVSIYIIIQAWLSILSLSLFSLSLLSLSSLLHTFSLVELFYWCENVCVYICPLTHISTPIEDFLHDYLGLHTACRVRMPAAFLFLWVGL